MNKIDNIIKYSLLICVALIIALQVYYLIAVQPIIEDLEYTRMKIDSISQVKLKIELDTLESFKNDSIK